MRLNISLLMAILIIFNNEQYVKQEFLKVFEMSVKQK